MATRIDPRLGDDDGTASVEATKTPAPPPNNSPRKVWIAAALTVFFPCVALAYAGGLSTALLLIVAYLFVSIVFGQTGLMHIVAGAWLFVIVALVLNFMLYVLPSWLAYERREKFRKRWYNHWIFYVIFGVATTGVFLFSYELRETTFGYGVYRVPSASMAPTLNPGDVMVIDAREKTLATLRAGDVVAYESTRANAVYVKRLVALPKQRVQIDARGVHVNGSLVPPRVDAADLPLDKVEYPDVELAYDQYYFIGDARSNSVDSRIEGPVPRSRLRGKVTIVWPAANRSRLQPIDAR